MAQGGRRRPSSAISEELGSHKQVGRSWSALLKQLHRCSYRLHCSGRHGILGHSHSACLLYRKSFKCIKLIILVTQFQLIQCVQSTGIWAWVPSWKVGEEMSSLMRRVKIQLSLGPGSTSDEALGTRASIALLYASDPGCISLHSGDTE